MYGHIQIVLTSTQKVNNVILIGSGYWFKQYAARISEQLKPPEILGYHHPRVFCVRSGINQ